MSRIENLDHYRTRRNESSKDGSFQSINLLNFEESLLRFASRDTV